MTRPVKGGWDFIKLGEVYQYKEDHLICFVLIVEDNSTDEHYSFVVKPQQSNIDITDETFEVSFSKDFEGIFSGMGQFYLEPEYMPLPLGTPWPYDYREEK